ncbi:efflux RND transporter permease subunit [Sphingorhabdus sp. IMCC26285]|jgi:multidrug efflux pump subunit AcrB|uniref:Efflux RND transporter permease subunit n=1 Tax=Sphingorhabdus profundilacus TaxID=2509718 RepID=A0A6I4LX18_9SPHN|nr:efflux RND transporter permease subunit [Sphingorhabdus profundilacus]MVZ96683.1 efflux RND transporter permease subunit [Sphingorhabdus profundilacus]
MHVAEVAIRKWQLTLVLFALLCALGFSAFQEVPRAVDPHFSMPVVSIVALQPGADPAEIEQTITKPIEELLQGLEDVQNVASTSTDGSAVIRAEFDWSGDPDQYFNDTVREVTAIRSQLPSDLQRLTFEKIRTTNTSILQIALLSETASWYRMEKYARDISEALGRYKEVRQSEIYGLPQPEISVSINAGRLAALRVPASSVADAIRVGGADVPAGAVTSGSRRFNVEAGGAFRDLDTIRNLPLRSNHGTLLRVGDIADVQYGAAEQRVKVSHNGQRAIWITANQKQGTDATKLRNLLVKELAVQQKLLPPDIKAVVQFDQSKDISKRLKELARDFGIALFLVLFTLLPLGWRASIIVMISIPLSIASGLLAISAMGFNLSQLVVAGFILSLGLLVDDSIVVVENIARHLRMGKGRDQAAIDGTKEITMAVIGSTGVLVFAFFPLFFLPEGAGKFTQSFIGTIVATITASMIVSLTIVPFLASRILNRDEHEGGNALLRWLMNKIDRFYHPMLHWALDRPRRTVWGALAITCAAFFLVPILGFSLFPNADTSYFRVTVETEQGSSIAETGRIVREVSNILKTEPMIKVRAENIGAYNPPVFYNVFQRGENPTHGEVLAIMDDWKGAEARAMIDRLRQKLDNIPGARIKIVLFQNGAPINAPVEFRVYGPEQDELRKIASKMEQVLRDTPGARDVNNPVAFDRVDLDVRIDDAKAALLDVQSGAARRAIRLALSGERSGTFRDVEGDSYPVVVRLPLAETHPISALESIYVPNRSGQSVQLAEISRPILESTPAAVYRYNLERNVSVTAQIKDGVVVSKVNRDAQSKMDKIALKPGYSIGIGGEAEKINDTFAGFGPIVMIAMFSIFAILVAEFGRYKEALVVAGVIPLGTFGGLIALVVTGNNLSFLAVIGFIALVGIEIKNSILLVDFTSQLRQRGLGLREAIEQAGEVRFLPVLLTSVTAIGGLMPLALFGGSLYGPLAIVLIGGLISSTLLSRIVTPAMYLLVVRGDDAKATAKSEKNEGQLNAT